MPDRWNHQRGVTLVELLIAVGVFVLLVTAFLFTRFDKAGEGESFAQLLATRLQERRANAIRLASNRAETSSTVRRAAPPVEINFTDWKTTAELKVEGGAATRLIVPTSGANYWQYVYQGEPVALVSSWNVVTDTRFLSAPPLDGFALQPIIAFAADGRLAQLSTLPDGSAAITGVYVTDGSSHFAVGVHQSGLVEVFQYDNDQKVWKGYGNRNVNGEAKTK